MAGNKKIVIFFGKSDNFNRPEFKQFRDGIFQKGIGSAVYNISDVNSRMGREEVLGTYGRKEAVVCCFSGEKSAKVAKTLKRLLLTVVTIDSADIANCGTEKILSKFI